jgi:hypothetical protein
MRIHTSCRGYAWKWTLKRTSDSFRDQLNNTFYCLFSDENSSYCEKLSQCIDAVQTVTAMEETLFNSNIVSIEEDSQSLELLQLESGLFQMAAIPEMVKGVIYFLPVKISPDLCVVR